MHDHFCFLQGKKQKLSDYLHYHGRKSPIVIEGLFEECMGHTTAYGKRISIPVQPVFHVIKNTGIAQIDATRVPDDISPEDDLMKLQLTCGEKGKIPVVATYTTWPIGDHTYSWAHIFADDLNKRERLVICVQPARSRSIVSVFSQSELALELAGECVGITFNRRDYSYGGRYHLRKRFNDIFPIIDETHIPRTYKSRAMEYLDRLTLKHQKRFGKRVDHSIIHKRRADLVKYIEHAFEAYELERIAQETLGFKGNFWRRGFS